MENTLKPIMENDRVRVLKVTFKPGETAAKHHHPDHLIYVINGGTLKLTVEGKVNNVDLKTGEAVFWSERWHEVKNTGNTTINLVVVEIK